MYLQLIIFSRVSGIVGSFLIGGFARILGWMTSSFFLRLRAEELGISRSNIRVR